MPDMKNSLRRTTVPLAGLLMLPLCHAEPLPLWEVGAGLGVINFPDYRGADTRNTYILPVPYLIYRGEFLKADREGVRGTLFENDKLEVNLSVNGTLPVKSEDNVARRGMSDLRPTVELGPTVDFKLWHSGDRKTKLDFRAPVRTAITIESSPQQIGWLFLPNLRLTVRDPDRLPGWNLGLQAGPIFSNREYNAHFYSVSASEANAGRPAYSARSGYSGSQVTMSVSKRFPRYWVGGFMRYDALAGAVFNDSPLLRKNGGVTGGIAVAWVFGQSSTLVDVED
jgi:outer membrane scaffolding protein for murein synthesis (MipA/OmpV family)